MAPSGPTSSRGKARSSTNAIRHGVNARHTVVGDETIEEHEANLADWAQTLRPTSPAEARVVALVADLHQRLERLRLVERKHFETALAEALTRTAEHRRACDVEGAVRALGVLRDAATSSPRSVAAARALAVAARGVVGIVQAVSDAPLSITRPLDVAVETLAEVEEDAHVVELIERIASITTTALAKMTAELRRARRAVATKKRSMRETSIVLDDIATRRHARYREGILKALASQLAILDDVQRIRRQRSRSSSFGNAPTKPVAVRLRVAS